MKEKQLKKILTNLQEINKEVLLNLDKDIDDLKRLNEIMMKEITENLIKHKK